MSLTKKNIELTEEGILGPASETGMDRLSSVENCARVKDLGYAVSTHINMYGERLELVSDPIEDGDCVVVQVISANDPAKRTLRLPISILLGLSDRSGQKTKFGKRVA